MPIKKKKISELNEAGDLKGFYTIGYRLVDGVKESVKIGLEYIHTAYEKVVQATKDAIAATIDMRQLEATVEGNEEAREMAESQRAAAEQGRQTGESVRSAAEDERMAAETVRQQSEADRVTAEDERKAAELVRIDAETERSTAEQNRKTAETGRVTAEQARVTEYAGIKAESEDVIASHRSAVASANQAAIYANQEGDTAKEKAALADAAAQAANTAATTIDDKMQAAINKLIAGAPDALDTLNELAAALGNDPNFATTIATELGKKLNKTDIVNDVVTGGVDKVLSAQQGVELAGQIVEMSKNAGGKMVLIPSAVLNLTNTSTSNEILDAFGGKEVFIEIVTKVKEGAPAAINVEGTSIIIPMSRGYINEVENSYILNFLCVDPSGGDENYSFSISLDGDVATIRKDVTPIGYANIIYIPFSVLFLSNTSSNNSIIEAFGGKNYLDSIVKKIQAYEYIGAIGDASYYDSTFTPITLSLQDYKDINNYSITLIAVDGSSNVIRRIEVKATNGVYSVNTKIEKILSEYQLVSDPSIGGTNVPASAEAVKVVNDKVATIQGKIDDGSLKGEKGDTGSQGATGPQGPAGETGNSFLQGVVSTWNDGISVPTVYSTGWFRSGGASGWYSQDYGGGIYMTDTTYVRTYNNKAMAAAGGFWKESDRRLKSHITPLRHTLDQILAIPTTGFVMNGKQQIGTIAQEVEKICPEVVSESLELKSQVPERDDWEVFMENDHKGNPQEYVKVKRVEYEMLGVLALEGVKLLSKEVEVLRNRLKELER